jgi:transcriptional regulator with XRE-family HTH domain
MGTVPQAPARPLWDRIETIRIAEDWSRSHVADLAGLPRSTIDRLKTNRNPPVAKTVNKIADAFGIPREEAAMLAGLHVAVPPKSGPAPARSTSDLLAAAEDLANELERDLHRRIGSLGYRQQIEVLKFLRQLQEPSPSEQDDDGDPSSAAR